MLVKSYFGKDFKGYKIGNVVHLAKKKPLKLSSGFEISNFPVAFQTYGTLNKQKSNAILICHALTGDQYLTGTHPVTGKEGWWQNIVGPGKPIDTDKYFVICPNVIGSCMGSFGPKENNPETGKPYNLDFPIITISDMVKAQYLLITEHFRIKKLFSVIGGSMGGMQALEWASKYPENVLSAIPIATAARHTAQNIAFHEVGRQAIMADPQWHEGNYLNKKTFPVKGLSVARMTAHITYLSEDSLSNKFGRNLQDKISLSYGFEVDFQVESYLRHQGIKFVDRFDANSYLYITKAMDYFDLEQEHGGNLSKAFANSDDVRFCLISFSDDWLFPPSEAKKIMQALNAIGINVSFINIDSNKGHDSFLLDIPNFHETIRNFLKGIKI